MPISRDGGINRLSPVRTPSPRPLDEIESGMKVVEQEIMTMPPRDGRMKGHISERDDLVTDCDRFRTL